MAKGNNLPTYEGTDPCTKKAYTDQFQWFSWKGLVKYSIPLNCIWYINQGNINEIWNHVGQREQVWSTEMNDGLRKITKHWELYDDTGEVSGPSAELRLNANTSAGKEDPTQGVGKVPFLDGQKRYITTNWGFYIYDLMGYSEIYGTDLFKGQFLEIDTDPEEDIPAPPNTKLVTPDWKTNKCDPTCHQVAHVALAHATRVNFVRLHIDSGAGSPFAGEFDLLPTGHTATGGVYERFYGEIATMGLTNVPVQDWPVTETLPLQGYHWIQGADKGAAIPGAPPLWVPIFGQVGTEEEYQPSIGDRTHLELENSMNHSHTVYMDKDMNGFTVDTIPLTEDDLGWHAQSDDPGLEGTWEAIAHHVHPVINGKIMPIALQVYSPFKTKPAAPGHPNWPLLFPPDVKWIHDHAHAIGGTPAKTMKAGGGVIELPPDTGAGSMIWQCQQAGGKWDSEEDKCFAPVTTVVIPGTPPTKEFFKELTPIEEVYPAIPDKYMEMIELHHNTEMFANIFHYNGLEKHPWFYGYTMEWQKQDEPGASIGYAWNNAVPSDSIRAFLQIDASFQAFLDTIGMTAEEAKSAGPIVVADEWPFEAAAYYINVAYNWNYLNSGANLTAKSHCVAGDPYMYSIDKEIHYSGWGNYPNLLWPTKEDIGFGGTDEPAVWEKLTKGIYLNFRTPAESISPPMFEDHMYETCKGDSLATGLKSEYNFHDVAYEYQSHYIDKPWLPNLYLFALSQESPFLFNFGLVDEWGGPHIDLFFFHDRIIKTAHSAPGQGPTWYYKNGIGEYYKEWTIAIENAGPPGDKSPTQENTLLGKAFFFDYNDFKLLRDHNYTKVMFPMYFEMFWNTPITQETKIIDIFAENPLLCEQLVACVYPTDNPIILENSDFEKTDDKLFYKISKEGWSTEKSEESDVWDITKLIYRYAHEGSATFPDFNGMHMDVENEASDAPEEIFIINSYNTLIDVIKEKFRCIQDIFDGEQAYNEMIFFEVIKKTIWGEDESPEQRYYFANPYGLDPKTSTRSSLIEFIDTQIVYEEKFNYEVFTYSIILGNKYHYVDHINLLGTPTTGQLEGIGSDTSYGHVIVPWSKNSDVTSHFKIINEPQILLKKSHYASLGTISISDDPPVPPDSVIYPYKDVKDKILIWFQTNTGEFDGYPVIILPEDVEKFTNIAISQGALVENGNAGDIIADTLIHFATDDPIKEYQIFRLDKKPKNWKDFAAGKIKLEEGVDAYLDTVEPNKKYYYTFRAVDFHDKVSNPSAIFEVELVHNSGATYPIINISQFAIEPTKTKQKNMRKYVHIGPTLEQSMLNAANPQAIQSALGAKPTFGSVFGHESDPRKFKVRFTSKSSGRKFDINLHFAHKHKNEVK